MKTFGLAMLIGNLAFVYPEYVRATMGWLGRLVSAGRLGRTKAADDAPALRKQSFAAAPR